MSDVRDRIAAALRANRGTVTSKTFSREALQLMAHLGARRPEVVVSDDLVTSLDEVQALRAAAKVTS